MCFILILFIMAKKQLFKVAFIIFLYKMNKVYFHLIIFQFVVFNFSFLYLFPSHHTKCLIRFINFFILAYALFFFYLIFLLLASKNFSKSIIIAFLHCHWHWHGHPTPSQIVSNSYKFFDCRC